jgi:hypothetical protein
MAFEQGANAGLARPDQLALRHPVPILGLKERIIIKAKDISD